MSIKWLDRTLVTSPVYYALCVTEKSFKKELTRIKAKKSEHHSFLKSDLAGATTHFFTRDNKISAIICIDKKNKYNIKQVYALLAHEAIHIWQEVKINIGENNPSHEFEAYAIQAIVQNLFYAYEKMVKK
jgi:hypothetical protein